MAKITKRDIDALQSEDGKPTFLWDGALSGFGVRALASGKKSFIVKYRTNGGGRSAPQRWLTLGTYGQLTLDQARQLAQKALAAVAAGNDPQRSKFDQRVAPDLSDVWERFEADILPMKKPTTGKEYRSQWVNLIEPRFRKRKVESITSDEIDRFHKSLRATPYRANRVLALLKHLMGLAEGWGMRTPGTNPCSRVEQFKERARERYLSFSELKSIGDAIDALVAEKSISVTAGHAIELLALSGARLSEVLNARWEWIDFDRGVMLLPDSKTGAKPIYLSDAAVGVLKRQKLIAGDSRFVFPSPKMDHRDQIVLSNADGLDFLSSFAAVDHPSIFFFIDPPYVQAGAKLYMNAMNDLKHRDLAKFLTGINAPPHWLVTYDDCQLIGDV